MTRTLRLSSSGNGLNDGEPYQIRSTDAVIAESGDIGSITGLHCVSSGCLFGSGLSGLG